MGTSYQRVRSGFAVAVALALLLTINAWAAPDAAHAAKPGGTPADPPSKEMTAAEDSMMNNTPMRDIETSAVPMDMPVHKPRKMRKQTEPMQMETEPTPDGPQEEVGGAMPPEDVQTSAAASSSASASDTSTAAASQNGAWPGAYYSNPNLQTGKLFFDVDPSSAVRWSHCSATAVNSENKSLVLTAGHCVYRPDPDGNGIISGNGYWYQSFMFCPGYENGCRLGTWHYRNVSTTWSWYGGYGSARYYDFRDDVAVLLMSPNSNGYLVNYVGGQGITWNAPSNQYRYSFGYPVSDWRWPDYSYSGEDMIYCPEYSYADGSIPGTMWMNCTMTGGSSGGPWLSYVGSNWLGYVNSVNSHKPYGGQWMSGPYFDNPEGDLFNYWRNR